MLERQCDIFERSSCILARSAEPIQQRLKLAWAGIGELKASAFETYPQVHELFQGLLHDAGVDATKDLWVVCPDFTGLSDQECERIAAGIFEIFVLLAKIRFGARHTTI